MRWSTDENFVKLFKQFRTQSADPELLLVTGTLTTTGTVTLGPMYRVADGAVSEPPAGDAAVRVLDMRGNSMAGLSFAVDFRVLTDPPTTTDEAPFAFAIPYPATAAQVQVVRAGQVLVQVFITTQLLSDAVESIPDAGFTKNPDNQRNTLRNKIDALDHQLAVGDLTGAKNKLQNDIRNDLVNSLVDGYSTQTPLQYTKEAILGLVDELVQRLGS